MEQPSTKPRRKRSASTPVRDVTEGRAEGALDLELENSALLSPLAYLLRVMRDPNASDARRDRAAVSAAQYVHQRAVETRRTKKSEAARKAREAGRGSEWGDDLHIEDGHPLRQRQ
jgi:hypothetical protein